MLTLGKFEVLSADNPLKFGRKTPRRPLALLRALTAVGPAGAPFYALTDHLWSDQEADRARHSLETAVHRLRRMLGEPGLVRIKDNRVSLDATSLWVDAWAFEEMASAENGSPRSSTDGGFQHAITLYRGAFLPDDDTPWVLSTRDRLRAKFIAGIEAQGKGLEEAAELSQALDCYRRGLAADDTAEAFYQGLMRCHARLGQRTEGILAYRHLRERLTLAHGTAPSRESERLHQAFSVP